MHEDGAEDERVLHILNGISSRHVDQVPAPPSDPLLGISVSPHNTVTHLVRTDMRIVGENQWRIMTVDFFEKNVLLPVFATFDQLFLDAAGFVVHTRLGLPHDDISITGVQDPASCSRADGSLHTAHVQL